MRIKGALHVHSLLSHDGTMTISELAAWYRDRGYQFIALGEHSQDLSVARVEALRKQSAENSDRGFCVIPGIEFSCEDGIHILGMGVTCLITEVDPIVVSKEIHAQEGFVVLTHPQRNHWQGSRRLLLAVDAVDSGMWLTTENICLRFKHPAPFEKCGR